MPRGWSSSRGTRRARLGVQLSAGVPDSIVLTNDRHAWVLSDAVVGLSDGRVTVTSGWDGCLPKQGQHGRQRNPALTM